MFKKILIILSFIIASISFYIIVGKHEVSIKLWLLTAMAPYIFLAGLSLIIKAGWLQMMLVPTLLFYGLNIIFNSEILDVGWDSRYAYMYISAFLMIVLAIRFCLSHLFRLRIIKITVGIIVGIILFFALWHYRINYISYADLTKVRNLEAIILY